MKSDTQVLADRLLAVPWIEDIEYAPSSAALLSGLPRRDALRAQAANADDLPDPFESLVQVSERGGVFGMETGTINFVHGLIVSSRSIDDYMKPDLKYDLSDEALASIDAIWQAEVAARIERARHQGGLR
ncbi:hypothetical protein ACFQY4_09440 [Catellatospora bangladeshensis]|uniref:Uncharacterized protein n=1 Tax=Catellatospora bangladeshensis TaxID=310355 RepID=A0A8J3JEG8_9ACTN|nr:hypothetical protein [Catellatospora bangladeshensis]GIF79057.1 hypothetical protein Cba03nite_04060 [Catellatospora bangladeshensis]